MKTLKNLLLLITLATLGFACEKEAIQPESANTQLFGNPGIVRPENQCGSSEFTSLVDGSGIVMGTVEIANNTQDVHVMVTMNTTRFLDEVKFFMGDATQLDNDGTNLILEGFDFQSVFTTPQGRYTFIFPHAALGACTDIVIWGRASTRNQFGQYGNKREVWLDGLPLFNLEKYKYCPSNCAVVPVSSPSTF